MFLTDSVNPLTCFSIFVTTSHTLTLKSDFPVKYLDLAEMDYFRKCIPQPHMRNHKETYNNFKNSNYPDRANSEDYLAIQMKAIFMRGHREEES